MGILVTKFLTSYKALENYYSLD